MTKVSAASSPSRTRRRSSRWRAAVDPLGSGQLGPGFAAGLDGLGQPGLVVLGQQRMLTDVVQVEADQVLLGLSGLLVGHSSSSLDVPGQILLAGAVGPGSRTANGARPGSQNTLINPNRERGVPQCLRLQTGLAMTAYGPACPATLTYFYRLPPGL